MVTDITTTTIHTSDRCQRSHYATLALRYGATYQIAQDFDLPALKIIGTPTALDNLNSHQEHSFQTHTNDCHISNLRYHAPNVNDKLAPYIPNDVDYVSYSPYDDKAVYCYYPNNQQTGGHSTCHFVHLYRQNHVLRLQKDDISAMQAINLELAKYNSRGKSTQAHYTFSEVSKWHKQHHLPYGFELHTIYDGQRWLAWGQY